MTTAAAVVWAAVTLWAPPQSDMDDASFAIVEVAPGTVGSSFALNAFAEWTSAPVGANRASGTVTGVDAQPGEERHPGDVLYRVDEHPVVIAQGDVPAYRAVAEGAVGEDVRQMQMLLSDLGFYRGPADGRFESGTAKAVRAWQKSLREEPSGVVEQSAIVFVPDLPSRIMLDPAITRGTTLAGGEPAVSALPPQPRFELPVSTAQAGQIPPTAAVRLRHGADEWQAHVSGQTTDANGNAVLTLAGADGTAVCGDDCAALPPTERTQLAATVVVQDDVAGSTVPSAAIMTTAGEGTEVVTEDGVHVPVTVRASARGLSVVDGVADGTAIRIPRRG